jgi:hypothetical protein
VFTPNSPFFMSCWDGNAILRAIAVRFVPKLAAWTNYERALKIAIDSHGWAQIEQFVLDARWLDVKKKAKKLRNVGDVRMAFEAMLLAGEVETAYRFVGKHCGD